MLPIIILLAYMALSRIKTVEQLQYQSPGELSKLMGLDRVPEVRCLRNKLSQLCVDNAPQKWVGIVSQQWLEDSQEHIGTLYVDGHVRLYHGHQTKLPRRYVSRQRLCLRGTTDYWVNDWLGLPLFAVQRPIDHGLLEALESDIVPKLLREIPNQPSQEQLAADPYGCRFVIVFDREYRSLQAKLQRRRAEFGAHTLGDFSQQDEGEALAKWEKRKAELGEAVEQLELQLQHVNQKRQETAHHLSWDEHPIEDKFERLAPSRKQLMDTVRMIAYRAQKRRWSSLSDRTYNARRMPAA